MNKEDKYSLGYAICNSIQNNKDKIEKLEKQSARLKKKNKDLQDRINKAIEHIELYKNRLLDKDIAITPIEMNYLLEILKGSNNE